MMRATRHGRTVRLLRALGLVPLLAAAHLPVHAFAQARAVPGQRPSGYGYGHGYGNGLGSIPGFPSLGTPGTRSHLDVSPMVSEALDVRGEDLRRILTIGRLVAATGEARSLILFGVDDRRFAVAAMAGGARFVRLGSDAELALDDIAARLFGPTRDAEPIGLFIDESALLTDLSRLETSRRWHLYRGDLERVAVWSNVYVREGTPEQLLAGLAKVRVPRSRRVALNLVDDPDTERAFRNVLAGERVTSLAADELSDAALARLLEANRGAMMFVLAHVEEGYVHAGGMRFALAALERAARARDVVLVTVGCHAGAYTTGLLGEINSIDAVRRIARAMRAPDLRGVLEGLASAEHPLAVEGELFSDAERILTASVRGEAPARRDVGDERWTLGVTDTMVAVKVAWDGAREQLAAVFVNLDASSHVVPGGEPPDAGSPGPVVARARSGDAGAPAEDGGEAVETVVVNDAGTRSAPAASEPEARANGAPSSGVPWGLLFGLGGVSLGAGAWLSLRRYRHGPA